MIVSKMVKFLKFACRFRQALAVVNDMSDPEDPEELRGLNIMRCQVGHRHHHGNLRVHSTMPPPPQEIRPY